MKRCYVCKAVELFPISDQQRLRENSPRPFLCVPFLILTAGLFFFVGNLPASESAPTGNPYDVLGKMLRPFSNVLLYGGKDPEKAMFLEMQVSSVTGRLPKQFVGASIKAWVENPDKVKLEAPVFGETFVVCRKGDQVWATPGDKVEFLLGQFKGKPPPTPKPRTPLFVPISAQQAVFMVALFELKNRDVAELDIVNGVECRVLTGGLLRDLAEAAGAADFEAGIWVDGTHQPRRLEIARKDFRTTVDILKLKFTPALPSSTWDPPAGEKNIYRTHADDLEAVLYVVVNSLHTDSEAKPWLNER